MVMQLPNREKAYIPISKLKDYLLSETHSVGKSKAKFLRAVGFNDTNTHLLKQGLINIAHSQDIKETILSSHGVKYIIDGLLQTAAGESVKMRTVWIIDRDQGCPRFVTAYPI
jgi:hypothetical protein